MGFELSAGAPIQWFERHYGVAYTVNSAGVAANPHLIDGLYAAGMSGAEGPPTVLTRAALSVHPSHNVEIGVAGGLTVNQRGAAQGLVVSEVDGVYEGAGPEVTLGGSAGYIEPFVRLFPISSGVFKPYLTGSFTFLLSPELGAESLGELGLPSDLDGETTVTSRPMKVAPMVTGGAGVAFDFTQTFSIFAEAQYSKVLPTTSSPVLCRGDQTFLIPEDMRCSDALSATAEAEGWSTGTAPQGAAAVVAASQPGELFATALRVNVGVQLRFF